MVKICDVVNGCKDCPKYGDDCDGETDRMTKEEAMRRLDGMKSLYPYENNPHKEAIDMAIEALTEPSKVDYRTDKSANIGTEVNDLISRADATGIIEDYIGKDYMTPMSRLYSVRSELSALPSADRPQGEWIVEKGANWFGGGAWKCSNCEYGYSFNGYHEADEFNFCPNCGADMKGKNNDHSY